jgi:hypothetical protein
MGTANARTCIKAILMSIVWPLVALHLWMTDDCDLWRFGRLDTQEPREAHV